MSHELRFPKLLVQPICFLHDFSGIIRYTTSLSCSLRRARTHVTGCNHSENVDRWYAMGKLVWLPYTSEQTIFCDLDTTGYADALAAWFVDLIKTPVNLFFSW